MGIAETVTAARGSLVYDVPATAVRGDDVERSAPLDVATAGGPRGRQRAATVGLLAMSDTMALVLAFLAVLLVSRGLPWRLA